MAFGKSFPDLFKDHRFDFINAKFSDSIKENADFLKVVITVTERDAYDAFEKAFKSLEVLRSLLCLQTTSYRTPIYKQSINEILLGDIFTMHSENGEIFDEYIYWYETQDRSVKIYKADKETLELLKRQTISLLSNIDSCKPSHKNALIDILNQYVSAYDSVNKTSCFLKGWTVLENLLNTHKNDELVRRCVAGYLTPELPKLQIDALKIYRNELVHELNGNSEDSETLTFCYILHNFLLSQISYHLNRSGQVQSVQHYSEYLDFLSEKKNIKVKEEKFKDF